MGVPQWEKQIPHSGKCARTVLLVAGPSLSHGVAHLLCFIFLKRNRSALWCTQFVVLKVDCHGRHETAPSLS